MIDLEAIRSRTAERREIHKSGSEFGASIVPELGPVLEAGRKLLDPLCDDIDALIAEVERLRVIAPIRCHSCLWFFERQASLDLHLIKGDCPGYAHTPITDFNPAYGAGSGVSAACICGWKMNHASLSDVCASYLEHLP